MTETIIRKAIEKRNQEIANLLWNTGKLTEEEIAKITNANPVKVDGMHGAPKVNI